MDQKIAREEEFQHLFEQHYRSVLNFFLARGLTPDDCQDLAQSTFLQAYRGFSSYRGESTHKTWLLSIAGHLYLNTVRFWQTSKRSGEQLSLESADPALLASPEPGPERKTLARNEILHLKVALQTLPAQMRRAVILHAYHGYSYREIAEILGVSVDTAKSHLSRGLKRVRSALE